MKVMKVNNSVHKVNAMQLAKTINLTKTLPQNVTKDCANELLTKKSMKLTMATLVGIAGIASSFVFFVNSIDAPNIIKDFGATILLVSSSAFSIAKSFKRKIVDKAYDILNFGEKIK